MVSTAYGGDSFLLCHSKDFNLKIIPENAKKFVEIAKLLLKDANKQIGFQHPKIKELNYISFCQFMDPLTLDKNGIKILQIGSNTGPQIDKVYRKMNPEHESWRSFCLKRGPPSHSH